jgi:hypothetical protein
VSIFSLFLSLSLSQNLPCVPVVLTTTQEVARNGSRRDYDKFFALMELVLSGVVDYLQGDQNESVLHRSWLGCLAMFVKAYKTFRDIYLIHQPRPQPVCFFEPCRCVLAAMSDRIARDFHMVFVEGHRSAPCAEGLISRVYAMVSAACILYQDQWTDPRFVRMCTLWSDLLSRDHHQHAQHIQKKQQQNDRHTRTHTDGQNVFNYEQCSALERTQRLLGEPTYVLRYPFDPTPKPYARPADEDLPTAYRRLVVGELARACVLDCWVIAVLL